MRVIELFAVEVKNINATVHIDGDRWHLIRRDHEFHGRPRRR